jgi:hypothetical protein
MLVTKNSETHFESCLFIAAMHVILRYSVRNNCWCVCRKYVQVTVTNTSAMSLDLSDVSLTVDNGSIELLSFNSTMGNVLVSIAVMLFCVR